MDGEQVSAFTSPLKVEFIDGKFWRLTDSLGFYTSDLERTIVAPEGFLTDFASIPRFAWPIIGHPTGAYGTAAVIHDWLYSLSTDDPPPMKRRKCDQIFLDGMQVLGVSWWKRTTMYSIVRLFGNGGWGDNRKSIELEG